MNGSGKAGNGRGNNRRRPFRRREKENDSWQDGDAPLQENGVFRRSGGSAGSSMSSEKGAFSGNDAYHTGSSPKKTGGTVERRNHSRLSSAAKWHGENQNHPNRNNQPKRTADNSRGEKTPAVERPKWVPPSINTDPLPVPDCPYCGKPIRDISSAIADKDTGLPVHFDCVTARIAKGENLEKGDTITYIGGGRFGIVGFGVSGESSKDSSRVYPRDFQGKAGSSADSDRFPPARGCDFKIKKIIEWENKDKKADWRTVICDHFSVT
ncbi:MAG: hypothetical protein FWF26_03595 [Treponema sp.]|nr:hypothetical protein [Treponema sp.]